MKKCKVCKHPFEPQYNTTEVVCRSQECRYTYGMKVIEQKRKEFKRQCAKEKKAFYDKQSSYPKLLKEARKVFQLWVRIRDNNQPCISCGKKVADKWDGGHWWKAELFTGLIFHEDNVHKQCVSCNKHQDGNGNEYRIGLVKRIGIERVEWLESNKDRLRSYRYTREELQEIKQKYGELVKQLKNN